MTFPTHGTNPRLQPADERRLAEEWGRGLFERQRNPVDWSLRVLEAVQRLSPGIAVVEAIIEVGRDKARWTEGHRVFDAARRRYLSEAAGTPVAALVNFAELVAKVIYNETRPIGAFDADSGWYIGPLAFLITQAAGDPALTADVRSALGDWPPVQEH